jgi:hypothetical protein
MTKKDRGRGPIFQSTSDGRIEEWRAPTLEALEDLYLELTKWRRARPEAMRPELWAKLDELLRGYWHWRRAQFPWTQERKDGLRWAVACKGIDLRGWNAAFDYASEMLKGSPAEAGPDMMKASYQRFQKKLPPERRRPRTYRRKRPLG